ncbi:MAG: flagellar motor switch protein FliN [Phycisphaerales bacterium]
MSDDPAATSSDATKPKAENAATAADDALDRATGAAAAVAEELAEQSSTFDGQAFARQSGDAVVSGIALLSDVNLKVKIELGRTRMYVEDVLRLNAGSVIELDKPAGDPVDIFVNDRHVARGEVIVVNENFCVRVSEILQRTRREG